MFTQNKKTFFVQKQNEVATSVIDLDVMIVYKDINLKILIIIIRISLSLN